MGINMYFDTTIEYEFEVMNEIVEKEMQRTKEQALKTIRSIAHFNFSRQMISVLAYAWMDSQPDAINLADKLNLSKLDFLAVMENVEAFREEYLKDLELAQNF